MPLGLIAALAVALLLVGTTAAALARPTAAAFTDTSAVTSGTIKAAQLTAPQGFACAPGGPFLSDVTLSWSNPGMVYAYQLTVTPDAGGAALTRIITASSDATKSVTLTPGEFGGLQSSTWTASITALVASQQSAGVSTAVRWSATSTTTLRIRVFSFFGAGSATCA